MPEDLPFIPSYMLFLEFESGRRTIAETEDGKLIVAKEGNQAGLRKIGDRLLEKKLIIGYQLVKTVSPPARNT